MAHFIIRLTGVVLIVLSAHWATAQLRLEGGVGVGVVTYQGDLARSHIRGTFAAVHPFAGLYVLLEPVRFASIESFINLGALSASDTRQLDEMRKNRNLSFHSPISEYGVRLNIQLPIRFGSSNVAPYGFIGIARFHFDPRTEYEGETIRLQPLGTEGQGLSIYPDRNFYELCAQSILVGGGIRVQLEKGWTFKTELSIHGTATDYLDDVSKTYPDQDALRSVRGDLAAALSSRRLDGKPPHPQDLRGNEENDDWFISLQLKFGKSISFYRLNSGRSRHEVRCPSF